MPTELFLTLGLLHVVMLASPGPDFALVLRSSHHRPLALGAALGIALAILLHSLLSLTGISVLLAAAPGLFALLKLLGALYLGWLALGALRAARLPANAAKLVSGSAHGSVGLGIRQGLATNLLNPKALLYFVGLLAAMVSPQVGLAARTLLAGELFVLSLLWFVALAWCLSSPRVQARLAGSQRLVNLASGVLFGLVSLTILLELAGVLP